MSIPNVENDVMTVSEEKCNTHTHLVFSFCYTFICPSADSRSLESPDKKRVCACACKPVCVHFSVRLTCHTKPGSSVKVKTRDLVSAIDRRNKR